MNPTSSSVLTALQQGAVGTSGNTLDYSYYDTLVLDHTKSSYSMFQVPVGQAGKTLADTNMVSAGQVPQGERLTVGALKLIYEQNSGSVFNEAYASAFFDFLMNSTFEFFIQTQDYGKWTLAELMGAPMLAILSPATAGNNDAIFSVGKYVGIYPLNIAIPLPALANFQIKITPQIATAGAIDVSKLRVSLPGILERASA